MRLVIAVFASVCGWAQQSAPPGILRGEIESVSPTTLEVRTSGGPTYRCTIDNRTYIERDNQRIFVGALHPDDNVEVVADRNASNYWARTIRVVRPLPTRTMRRSPLPRPYRALDHVFPRGNLTFSGVVRRISPGMMVLFTRDEPEKVVLLRDDTRYLSSGLPSEFNNLAVNTRVFVRGGNNFENDLEAYQVVWGEIAGPKRRD